MLASLSKVAIVALLAQQSVAQTLVSSAVFDKFVRYTAFASAGYAANCSKPAYGSTVVSYFNDTTQGTGTRATLFRDDSAKELILTFKGTSTPQDLDTDLRATQVALTAPGTSCSKCLVHQGFQAGYNSLAAPITSAVKSQLSAHPGYTFTLTGHSLGGGLSAIATSSLIGQGVPVANVYTFGEPRNGDSNWATYINGQIAPSNYYRVTHANDGVPQIPPPVLNYQHHGQEYWESVLSGNNSASTTYACPTDSPKCNAGTSTGTNPIDLAHLSYTNSVIGSSLFIAGCGAVFP